MVADKGIKIKSPLLTSQGKSEGDGGKEYLHLAGQNLKSGRILSVEISNLPGGQPDHRKKVGPSAISSSKNASVIILFIAIGLLAIVSIVYGTAYFKRKRKAAFIFV